MIRPLDIQVAWKAVPLQAKHVLQEQASALYRSIQNLNESYSRNMEQAKTITKIKETAKNILGSIQRSDINVAYSLELEDLKQRSRERKNEDKLNMIYAPRQSKSEHFSSHSSFDGDLLNLKA